jgi:hypothetical protein
MKINWIVVLAVILSWPGILLTLRYSREQDEKINKLLDQFKTGDHQHG